MGFRQVCRVHDMTPIEEILTITQEECAEVIQVISKGRRFGYNVDYNGVTNGERLTQEVGDVLAMIDLLVDYGVLVHDDLMKAKDAKFEKLKQWSNIGI